MNSDRMPPHNPEAETSILACILQCPKVCLNLCRENLESGSEVFYDPRNRVIFDAMIGVEDSGCPVDIVTLQEFLKNSGRLDQVGGITALLAIQDAVGSAANLKYYLDIVQEKYLLRRVVGTCAEIASKVYDHEGEIMPFLDEMERKIMAIRPTRTTETAKVKELVAQSLSEIEAQWECQGKVVGVTTGFVDLDRMCGGLKAGEMTVIAGFPGAGKTSLAMNIGEHALLKLNRKIGVFSLEMSAVSLVTRFICSHARVDMGNVRKGGEMNKREFWCDTCSMKEPVDGAALKAHLASVHGLDGKVTGSRKGVASIDGENFYQNTYEWRLPGDVRVTEVHSGTSD